MSQDYPSNWDTRRREVYQRDKYECQNCGILGGPKGDAELHAHHVVPNSKGGTHQKSNLKTVCKECHDAIHGSSMAPSINTEQTTEQLEFPIDLHKFPHSVSDYINCVNIIVETQQLLKSLSEGLEELNEYADMHSSINSDIPKRLKEKHSQASESVDAQLDSLRNHKESLNSISKSKFDEGTYNNILDICRHLEKVIHLVEECRELIQEMARTGEIFKSDQYEIRLLKEDISDTSSGLDDSIESLISDLRGEIQGELQRLNELSTGYSFGGGIFDYCPICEGGVNERRFSYENIGFDAVRCEDCMTEWLYTGMAGLEVTHSTFDIEGVSLVPLAWDKIRENEHSVPDDLSEYKTISRRYTRYKSWSLYPLIVFGFGSVVWVLMIGRLILFIPILIISLVYILLSDSLLEHWLIK